MDLCVLVIRPGQAKHTYIIAEIALYVKDSFGIHHKRFCHLFLP
jgi:hypothetical protein